MANIINELHALKSIPKDIVFDNELSDRAKFVYIYMACKPEGWDFYLTKMAEEIGYSVDTLRKYIQELVASGWLEKGEQRNNDGSFGCVEYIIKSAKFSDTEIFRHGKNPTQNNNIYNNNNSTSSSLNNIKKDKDNTLSQKVSTEFDYQALVDYYNEHLTGRMPKAQKLSKQRKQYINARLKEYDVETLYSVIDKCMLSSFLTGQRSDWCANFDWIFMPTNFLKILEGNYDCDLQEQCNVETKKDELVINGQVYR